MNVYALTPTGARPEGLALLGEYINAQTYGGSLTWVIVDDCDPSIRIPRIRDGIDVVVVRPPWRWKVGMNTQVNCMRVGLQEVPEDTVLFILEDDDIYLPDYMSTSLQALDNAELVGEIDSRYYNVATNHWRILPGKVHSSLASTACRGRALMLLRELCNNGVRRMLDFHLWKTFKGDKRLMHSHNVVGIKGLPGRPGIGVGHRRNFGTVDVENKLREWACPYEENYLIFKEAV